MASQSAHANQPAGIPGHAEAETHCSNHGKSRSQNQQAMTLAIVNAPISATIAHSKNAGNKGVRNRKVDLSYRFLTPFLPTFSSRRWKRMDHFVGWIAECLGALLFEPSTVGSKRPTTTPTVAITTIHSMIVRPSTLMGG